MEYLYVIKRKSDGRYMENWTKMQSYSDKLASTFWSNDKGLACTFAFDAAERFIARYELKDVVIVEM